MKYRIAIRSNGLYSPSFTLSKGSSGVFLTLRDSLLNEKRSVHFENDIKHDKRHLYRGHHGESPYKRRYEMVGGEKGRQVAPECSYLLGRFSLCATEEEFRQRRKSDRVAVFDYDIAKNDTVSIHLVSAPKDHEIDCPPSFRVVKVVIEDSMKWMLVLEQKQVHSVYDMVTRSVLTNGLNAVCHGSKSKGGYKHMILVSDLHEDYRPQRHAQMSVVIANRDFEAYIDSGQLKIEGYIVRK